ncbi:MAG: twin-arginine translocase subunit TatC [Limisphaerales bacterium]
MGTEPEEEYSHHEEEGGPTKSFLEHLEDLRWTLMKSVAAIAVGFLVCLFAAPTLVKILTWPLERSEINRPAKNSSLTFLLGTNRLGTFNLETNSANLFGANRHNVLEIAPIKIGTNTILGLKAATNDFPEVFNKNKVNLRNFGPAAGFMIAVKMAIYGGIILASPFLFYFIAAFVFPALKIKEKKYTFHGLAIGTLLFMIGVCFCYFLLMPIALTASVRYSEWMGFKADEWRAEEYMGFVCKFLLGMGLGFELPVVILVLVKIGILDYEKLAGFRRYMIVVCLVLGAVLTTPEVVTQVLTAVPLYLLYEITIWIAWYWEQQEKKRDGIIELEK